MTDVRFFLGGPLHTERTTGERGGTVIFPAWPADAIYRAIRIAGERYYLLDQRKEHTP